MSSGMHRRLFLTTVGAGAAALAGCTDELSLDGSDDESSGDDDSDDGPQNENEQRKMMLVEDGKREYGHNIYLVDLLDISTKGFSAELTTTVNPVADYEIHAHITPLTDEYTGDWEFIKPAAHTYSSPPEYNDTTHEWEGQWRNARLKYVVDDGVEKPAASVTVPKDAFGNPEELPGGARGDMGGHPVETRDAHGFPIVIDFDFDQEPPMYEPFVLTFTWEDENTHSNRSGEVVTNSMPIVRTNDDTFVHPRILDTGDFNLLRQPNWDGQGLDDFDGYSLDDVYVEDIETEDSVVKGTVVRFSHYGRFSEKFAAIARDGRSKSDTVYSEVGDEFLSTVYPKFLDGAVLNPWSLTYEFSEETVEEAQAIAESYGAPDDPSIHGVHDLLTDSEVMNHEVVQDVASQLGDVCDRIGATEPTEQLRIVADFVQYFDHTVTDLGEIPGDIQLAPGTSHPVKTLERGYGDCKDYTVLGNALLQQDPFNFTTHAGHYSDVSWVTAVEDEIGHVSTIVRIDDLEIDSVSDDDINPDGPLVFVEETLNIDGDEYVYVEMSAQFPIGYQVDSEHNQFMDGTDVLEDYEANL